MKYILIIIALALGISACGSTKIVETTVTVTPTPTPTYSPYFTDNELEGLETFGDLIPELEHILKTEKAALKYGAKTGNISGVIDRADHYANDYQEMNRNYNKTNGGDYYGGKLSRLENLFESAGNHTRRFGRGILTAISGGTNAQAETAGEQLYYAERDLEKLKTEYEDLLFYIEDETGY